MSSQRPTPSRIVSNRRGNRTDPPGDIPEMPNELDDDTDLDDFDPPCTDADDGCWDVFIPDDDERDPLPEAGDFWMDGASE